MIRYTSCVKIKSYTLVLFCIYSILAFLQIAHAQNMPFWQTPSVVQENRLPARATSISYPSQDLALEANRDASPRKLLINGNWKFYWSEAPSKSPNGFYEPSFNDANWATIPIPSNWELHGYGKPWQRLTPQIWEHKGIKVPHIPTDYNPTGCYRKTVNLPNSWNGMQYTLHVGAASSALLVWVNGNYVGYSEDNRLPAEFDVTPHLKSTNNLIAFKVLQWCDGSYLEDQDHWRMSGITREVFIEAAPQVQLYDFALRTDLDDDYKDAQLQIRPKLKIYNDEDITDWKVEAQLYDAENTAVLKQPLSVSGKRIKNENYPPLGNRPFENLMEATVKNPKKWSAEHPNLYTLVLSLKDGKGNLVEARSTKIGFREIDTSDGQFKINGVPVLLYGVNRHDWDAQTGKAVTKEAMRRDAELMKQMNVNASRCSHYPNPPYWYELCDEYGIYVMDEANIESHGVGSLLSNTPEWHTSFLERGLRMVERDKNYPCIVSWSLGNEAGFGPNHAALSGWIKEFDSTRPIHSEGAQDIFGYRWPKPEPKDKIFTDIISRMYRLTDDMIDLATKQDDNRPVIWCEYVHSQANSTGDLESYWAAIRKYPRLVGGFVWDWRDQLIAKKSTDGKTLWKHGMDFGQEQADLNPIQKGLISADGKIKSGGWQAKYVWQRVKIEIANIHKGEFTVENRHFRTNLNTYNVVWEIIEDGKSIHTGTTKSPDIEAGKKGKLHIQLPEISMLPNKRYHLNISFVLKADKPWAEKGFAVASEQFLLAFQPQIENRTQNVDFNTNETTEKLKLKIKDATITFDKNTGQLAHYGFGNTNFIKKAPQPNFWRAPTDNDLASRIMERQGMWKTVGKDLKLVQFDATELEGEYRVETSFQTEDKTVQLQIDYAVQSDASITVKYRFFPVANLPDLPRIGFQMEIPNNLENMQWFGRGPLESYADKKTGAFFGNYKTSVKEDFTYYVRPQESSNKTDVYWATLTDSSGKGLKIEALNIPVNFSVWPFDQEQLENAGRIEELQFGDTFTLNIDHKQMGVGGDNTWDIDAAPHKPFRIPPKPYNYEFTLKLIQ